MNKVQNALIIRPRYTLSEELISAITHGMGMLLSIAGMVLCIVKAASGGNRIGVVSSALYGSFMIILYLMSTLYHSFSHRCKAKKVFRVFDHCCIFLLIFGINTIFPLLLFSLFSCLFVFAQVLSLVISFSKVLIVISLLKKVYPSNILTKSFRFI